MPASTTSAPLSRLSSIIFARLSRSVATGWPRKPSLPPSSMHDERGLVRVEQPRQTREPAGRRVARDAGIHYLITVTFRLQAILEHRDPRLPGGYPIAAAQGVAHHDDGLPGAARCRQAENGERKQGGQTLENEHRRVPVTSRRADEKG